jgi:hypothetical protein
LTLDLGKNNIGGADVHKYGYEKSTKTKLCGELLADYLNNEYCKLQVLLLDWNLIRQESAVFFMKCMKTNKTLIELNIAYNNINCAGGEVLGDALTFNKTLQKLNISSNNISPRACVTIATGIIYVLV